VRSRGPAGTTAGFTLIELVVVFAVLAAVVGLALPAVRRGSEGLRLRADAGRVAAVLREARQRAVTERRPTRVALERERQGVALAWEGEDVALRRVELAPPVRLEALVGGPVLTFSPRGLTHDARWAIEAPSGRRLIIDVHGVTGRVSVTAPSAS
jgi:general secretion pathway protein H